MKCPRCGFDNAGVPVSEGIFICCQCRVRINMNPEVLEILSTETSDYDMGYTAGYQSGLDVSKSIMREYQKAWDAGYEAGLEEIKRQKASVLPENPDHERIQTTIMPDPITGESEYSKDPNGDSPYPVVEI